MSEEFDLTKITEGLTAEEAMEFVKSVLTPEAKQAFVAKRKTDKLQAAYDKEMEKVNANMPHHLKIKRMTEIKSRFRQQGLEVY